MPEGESAVWTSGVGLHVGGFIGDKPIVGFGYDLNAAAKEGLRGGRSLVQRQELRKAGTLLQWGAADKYLKVLFYDPSAEVEPNLS
jgi:hypothetical protein